MFEIGSRKFVYLIAVICFASTLVLILLSQGTYDPGDGVQHYLIAKYALKHPLLLLDHWGKPIYTLLCMPFAQFGFIGSNIYNLMCNTATALIAYQISTKLDFKNAWLTFLFVFFSPLFYMTSYSGLTEPTFALILTSAVLLITVHRYTAAALLISFLPFARTEGFFIIPLFVLYLSIQKQWKAVIFCGFATLMYAIIGYFVLDDFFWIIHQNPYKGAYEIYGKGPLMHFVAANDRLFGLPLVFLFLLACMGLILGKVKIEKASLVFYLLIAGSFVVYFVLHSVFWWKGWFGSLGLHRVMAGVAPLFSIIALLGYNFLSHFFMSKYKWQKAILVFVLLAIILFPFKQYQPPLKAGTEIQVLNKCADWITKNNISTSNKVYCMYPMLSMLLDVDIFNQKKYISTCMLKYNDFNSALLPGDLILWDSHFGHECGFLPSDIAQLPKVKKIAHFEQLNYNHQNFEIDVFTVIK